MIYIDKMLESKIKESAPLYFQNLKTKLNRRKRLKLKALKDITRGSSSHRKLEKKEKKIKISIQNSLLRKVCLGCGESKKNCICLDSSLSEVATSVKENNLNKMNQ